VRLVVVTQQVDPASPVLGATVAKLRALAERVDELVVLADSAVDGALPDNCRVRLFRSGHRAGRGLRFESALSRELARRPRPRAVLAHMCPIYAVLAAPVARPLRVPVLLWFTHWRRSRLLSTAELVSNLVLSVDQRTFPMRSKKVVAIGHGIDVSDLPCVARPTRDELTLLALGRTSPSKGLETIIRAVALVPDVRLLVSGSTRSRSSGS
jgi:glycosyltransferase involved in cell wall biosynthesis